MADTGYITKESALSCFNDWIDCYGHEHTADEMTEYLRIEELPEKDVVEVRHGKWLDHQHGRWVYAQCSECGTIHDGKSNFCPECGADMRRVGDKQ